MYVLNLVPVTSVSITGYVSGTQIAAGQSMILTCTALDGNPTPTVKWYKDNIEIDSTIESASQSQQLNAYSFVTTVDDNGLVYRCESDNGVTSPLVDEVTFNIEGIFKGSIYIYKKLFLITT